MDIEEKIFTEEEREKLDILRRKNVLDKINKESSIKREEELSEWKRKLNTKTKVLNLGVRIREEFKKMGTRQLLSLFKEVRFRNKSNYWDDDSADLLEELELKTELSQREHVETDKSVTKKKRQLAAKKNKGGRRSHKKKS